MWISEGYLRENYFIELLSQKNKKFNSLIKLSGSTFITITSHKSAFVLDAEGYFRTIKIDKDEPFASLYNENKKTALRNGFEGILVFYDFKNMNLFSINFNQPPLQLKDKKNRLIEMPVSAPYKGAATLSKASISHYYLDDISIIFASPSKITSLIFHKTYQTLFSKQDILNFINNLGENLQAKDEHFSLILINCDINKGIEYQRGYILEPKLEFVKSIELEFEKLINEYFNDPNLTAKTLLVINELLMNAFEHGILKISSKEKQKLMSEGTYDEFIASKEKSAQGTIELTITFYEKGILKIKIKDSGDGFDFDEILKLQADGAGYSGRGIVMSKNISNALFYSDAGREVNFFIRYEKISSLAKEVEFSENEVLDKCSVLYVEDEQMIRVLFENYLKKRMKIVYVAENGLEGLNLFKKYKPQIVISDVHMPEMNGLEMIKEIKKIKPDTYTILATAHDYDANIYDALLVGVNKFVSKPIDLELFRRALHSVSKSVFKNILRDTKQQILSLEDMRAKTKYESEQHQKAFEKQKLLIRDESVDFTYFDIRAIYKPLETLSGDIYGIIRIKPGIGMFYIIDSMDKGLVASVTAVLSAAFINRYTDWCKKEGELDLQGMVNKYMRDIKNYLLQEECISFAFVKIDEIAKEMEYVMCGMYPIILKNIETKETSPLKSPYAPYIIGDTGIYTKKVPLPESYLALIYSDGICEFDDFRPKDFANFVHENDKFEEYEKLINSLEQKQDGLKDDMTLIHISNTKENA